MTPPTITRLPSSKVEISCTVTPQEAKPYLDQAVTDISTNRPIQGFRPGKAGYDDVKRAYGEMTIWESALERIVRATYVKAVLDEHLETIGSPEITVDKLVPNETIAFKITTAVMPEAKSVLDYSKPLTTLNKKPVTSETVEKGLLELRTMRRVEAVVDRAAEKEDMVMIDLEIKKDNVPLEGGASKDYRIYLNEEQYIPGFADKLLGAKRGETRVFTLPFPEEYYAKHLAGQEAEFTATVKDVYGLELPALDDAFARGLGIATAEELRALLTANLEKEEAARALEAAEIAMLDALVKGSTFSDIPDILVSEEVRRMIQELMHTVDERGMKMEDYLKSIKKTIDDLRLDFVPRAIERVKAAILIRTIANKEKITVSDEEADIERDRILDSLKKDDAEARKTVISPEYHDYLKSQLRNRKVMEFLRLQAIEGYVPEKVEEAEEGHTHDHTEKE
jgi:trigger factor